jgi:hypothetical protein
VLIALAAEPLGLDRGGGWGRARFATLAIGLFMTAAGGLLLRYGAAITHELGRLGARAGQLRMVRRMNEDGALTRVAQTLQRDLPDAALVLLVLAFYLWFASAGRWDRIPSSTTHYQLLASGFERGRLSLPIDRSNWSDLPRDLSRFEDKYYMYWGPAPALIVVALRSFTNARIADAHLAFGFVCGTFLMQCLLLRVIWHRHFQQLPAWTLQAMILFVGVAGPPLFLRHNHETAKIYEAAINAGQFFLMAGVLALAHGLSGRGGKPSHFALAGALWAFAFASRLTLAVPIAFGLVVIVLWSAHAFSSWRQRLLRLVSLGLPLALSVAILGWYNWARFGSVMETGFSYQLAPVLRRNEYRELWDARYVIPNIYNYVLHPPSPVSSFPFVQLARGYEPPAKSILHVPEFYNAQPVTGLVWFVPFAVFAIPASAAALRMIAPRRFTDGQGADAALTLTWASLVLGVITLGSFAFNTTYFWAGMRYAEDFLPSLSTLAAVGFWEGFRERAAQPTVRRVSTVVAVGLLALSLAGSVLLALSTNSGLLR